MLNKLITRMNNGMIKVVTGVRRSGKTYLLFKLFSDYLREKQIPKDHIIKISLDDRTNKSLRDPDTLLSHVLNQVKDNEIHYVLLDEVQMVSEFEDVLNSFLHHRNIDVYVTGSNARFLSKDVITEFRGRGDEVNVRPLSFAEFWQVRQGLERQVALLEYMTYGGLPQTVTMETLE